MNYNANEEKMKSNNLLLSCAENDLQFQMLLGRQELYTIN